MIQDTLQRITAATIGLGLAAIAYQSTKAPKVLGRATWDDDKDVRDYDYVILGGNHCLLFVALRVAK